MIHSIEGTVVSKGENFFVVVVGGLGFKVFTNVRNLKKFAAGAGPAKFFTHLQVREDGADLYGFEAERELAFFELLISVSGVGPRSALAVMQIAELDHLAAAIKEGRPDALTRAAGIGRKTAERIIVELRTKVSVEQSGAVVKKLEMDADIVETLVGLGYGREQVREALSRVGESVTGLEGRLKTALKILSAK